MERWKKILPGGSSRRIPCTWRPVLKSSSCDDGRCRWGRTWDRRWWSHPNPGWNWGWRSCCLPAGWAWENRTDRSTCLGRWRCRRTRWRSRGTDRRGRRTWWSWRRRRPCRWTRAPCLWPWRHWLTWFGSNPGSRRTWGRGNLRYLRTRCSFRTSRLEMRPWRSWRWPWWCPWRRSSGPGWGSNAVHWPSCLKRKRG